MRSRYRKILLVTDKPLVELGLAEVIGVVAPGDSDRVKAGKLVAAVRDLSSKLDIPTKLEALRSTDIPGIVKEAADEGRTYGVPVVLGRDQITSVLIKLLN